MFEFLSNIDNSITSRYFTVERNIKSHSNSFYDSYLDLLESTYKRILVNEKIPYDPKYTCGQLLRQAAILKFLKNTVKIDSATYDKSLDYIKKTNEHKHKGEKNINSVTVVSYMKVYYDVARAYLTYKGVSDIPLFDSEYLDAIFGITVKQNKQLLGEVDLLRSDIEVMFREKQITEKNFEEYKSLLSLDKITNLPLEEQNEEIKRKIEEIKRLEESVNSKLDSQSIKLDEIKESIDNSLKRSISQQIGMDFQIVYDKSTIYCFEDDIVRFKRFKKRSFVISIINLLVALGLFIYGVIDFVKFNNYFIFMVVLPIILLATFSVCYAITEKEKKKAHSFFNAINYNYRMSNDRLISEEATGLIAIIFKIVKFTISAVSLALAIFSVYQIIVNTSLSRVGFGFRTAFLYAIPLFVILILDLPKYPYRSCIFDAGDIKVLHDWDEHKFKLIK